MNADRESNRLPLRAGAMVLFAVAIVFVALGWHHAATSGNNPEAQLQAAQSSVPSTTSAPASTSSSAAGNARICVINAGTVTGLATEVDEELKGKGFTTIGINAQSNYDGGFSQNTIVYSSSAQKDEADKIAQALDNDYTVDSRASLGNPFSRCVGGIAVVAVQR
ncbi:LytR family transcriptional regulator [Gordonia oryzae]|uniref:LytR family transcriptional regulator n=1 Tax=Gordonia oryzae TaxID=2487349 RepID=A0A3N4G3Z8_9ACTN|nr:LytR C-terminal domain-containing protein [Gordonia oryzae]RPA57632.1 LytR family transcriptional regulator [Gordonia oryzae]